MNHMWSVQSVTDALSLERVLNEFAQQECVVPFVFEFNGQIIAVAKKEI